MRHTLGEAVARLIEISNEPKKEAKFCPEKFLFSLLLPPPIVEAKKEQGKSCLNKLCGNVPTFGLNSTL